MKVVLILIYMYDAISASDAYTEYKQTVSDVVNKLVER